MSEILSSVTLRQLVDKWIGEGRHVAGPRLVNDRLLYGWLESAGQLTLDDGTRPRNSIKEFLFPRHEKLYGYKLGRKRVELTEVAPLEDEQIVIAARPCDAALGPVMAIIILFGTDIVPPVSISGFSSTFSLRVCLIYYFGNPFTGDE